MSYGIIFFIVILGLCAIVILIIYLTEKIKQYWHRNETEKEKKNRELKRLEKIKRQKEAEVNFYWQFTFWSVRFVIILIVSILLASIITIEASFSVKFIIFFFFLVGVLILVKISQTLNVIKVFHFDYLVYAKAIFSSVECLRLEPENKNMINPIDEDVFECVSQDKKMEEFQPFGTLTYGLKYYFIWIFYFLGTSILTYLLVVNWDVFISINIKNMMIKFFKYL
mgnify:CR=1 FL=1